MIQQSVAERIRFAPNHGNDGTCQSMGNRVIGNSRVAQESHSSMPWLDAKLT
jgi:hypothetical protein